MDWTQVLTVFVIVATNLITVITLHIHLDSKTTNLINVIHQDMKSFQNTMIQESKDFHGRLCAIEERNKK